MPENSIVDHVDLLIGYNVVDEVSDILGIEYFHFDDRAPTLRADAGLSFV